MQIIMRVSEKVCYYDGSESPMKPLVVIENDKVVTDSLTIAKAFNKKHSDILSHIKFNIKNSIDAGYSNWIKRNIELTN